MDNVRTVVFTQQLVTVPSRPGGFGYVFLAQDVNTGKNYAIKRLCVDAEYIKAVKREINLMVRSVIPHQTSGFSRYSFSFNLFFGLEKVEWSPSHHPVCVKYRYPRYSHCSQERGVHDHH